MQQPVAVNDGLPNVHLCTNMYRMGEYITITYIMTIPRNRTSKRELREIFAKMDCKRYCIAIEKGKDGYEHFQVRVETSSAAFFEYVKKYIRQAHIEKSTTEYNDEYEKKDGRYFTSYDTIDVLKVRFGKMRPTQENILEIVNTQNDREVDVFLDPKGNNGKTWLTLHLWEQRQALVVPRASTTAEKLSAFVCSAYRGEPYIIIDIPRAGKPAKSIYEAIEELKDGLVFDQRYSGKARNVRGAKVIVFTNVPLDKKMLSADRWRLHGIEVPGGTPS